jgi:hypothetical protein
MVWLDSHNAAMATNRAMPEIRTSMAFSGGGEVDDEGVRPGPTVLWIRANVESVLGRRRANQATKSGGLSDDFKK